MLTIRDTDRNFELNGDLLKMITKKNYSVDLAKLPDKKSMFKFARERLFDEKDVANKSSRDKSPIRLPK